MKEALLRFTVFPFSAQTHFQWSATGTLAIASKSLFLKHQEGSTQHGTLLVVSPGSLHMNTNSENIVCVHRVHNTQKIKKPRLHFGESFALSTWNASTSACATEKCTKLEVRKWAFKDNPKGCDVTNIPSPTGQS